MTAPYTLPNGQPVQAVALLVTVHLPSGRVVQRWAASPCSHAVCFDDEILSLCETEQQAKKRIKQIACPQIRATLQIVSIDA